MEQLQHEEQLQNEEQPIKRKAGRPKLSKKTENIKVDENYFKNYYKYKTKVLQDQQPSITCPICKKILRPNSLIKHEKDKVCNLLSTLSLDKLNLIFNI
jgi:hypothetical protein